jgi:hypothetical protein
MELAASLVPEQKLNQLKNELDVAIQQLQQIEDELGIVKVEGALAGLKAATSSQDGKRLTFEKKLESLEMVSARIVATMKKSPPLSEGAKALELRGAFEGAKRSTMVYIEAAETLDVDLQQLAGRYSSFGSAFSDSATKYQDAVRATAGGNATTLYEVSVHLKSLIPSAKSAQDYATTAGDKASSVGFYKMLPELKKAIL